MELGQKAELGEAAKSGHKKNCHPGGALQGAGPSSAKEGDALRKVKHLVQAADKMLGSL